MSDAESPLHFDLQSCSSSASLNTLAEAVRDLISPDDSSTSLFDSMEWEDGLVDGVIERWGTSRDAAPDTPSSAATILRGSWPAAQTGSAGDGTPY